MQRFKYRVRNGKLLEGLDEGYDPATAGEHLSPQQWNQMLDQSKVRFKIKFLFSLVDTTYIIYT